MNQYHKIQTVFKRDPETNHKTLLEDQYSIPEFEYLKDNEWVFTEKVDGTNIRVMWDGEYATFGGKTDRAQIPAFLLEALAELFPDAPCIFNEILDDACENVCLYGEGYGAKIQKGGGNYRSGHSFVLFDVKVGDWWLQRKDVEDIAAKFGIDTVPIIGEGKLSYAVERTREGFTSQWGDFKAEGIVARPKTELVARNGKRIITKIKHRDFR